MGLPVKFIGNKGGLGYEVATHRALED